MVRALHWLKFYLVFLIFQVILFLDDDLEMVMGTCRKALGVEKLHMVLRNSVFLWGSEVVQI